MDDTQLIRRYVAEGSEAAFAELVGRYLGLVHSAALRQVDGDFHLAKDVSQKVFILLARKAPSLTRHPALTGWLYATTHFSACALMRGERRRRIREEETYKMNELLAGAESEVDWHRLRPVLDGVMFELNEQDREAILGRYFDALPLAVLGGRLGVSENAARKRVDRALDKMRVALAKRGARSTTATLAMMLAGHAVGAVPAGLAETVTSTAMAASALAGSPVSWLLNLPGKIKLAAGIGGAIWVGGILAVPAVGAAAYELWTAGRSRAALIRENEGYAAQQESFRDMNRTINDARLAARSAARTNSIAGDPKADFQKFLAAYPQARTLALSSEMWMARQIYASFYRSAGLTPLQIGQFERVLAEKWLLSMRMVQGLPAEGRTPLPPADELSAILGPEAYEQLLVYDQTEYAHYWAERVAGYAPETSFSPEQLDRLTQVLAKSTTVSPDLSLGELPQLSSIGNWDAVLAQARPIFSESQWKSVGPALRTLQVWGALASARQAAIAADTTHEN